MVFLLFLAFTAIPSETAGVRCRPKVMVTGIRAQVGRGPLPLSQVEGVVVEGEGACRAGMTVAFTIPGVRRGQVVTSLAGRPFPGRGSVMWVELPLAGPALRYVLEGQRRVLKEITQGGAPVVAVNERGVPLFWPVRGIYLTPSSGCSEEVLGTLQGAVAAWTARTPSEASLELILDPPSERAAGYTTEGTNYNVVLCLFDEWSYGALTDGLTLLTYVDEPGTAADGKIIDADILLNCESGGLAGGDADLSLTIITHELGHLIGMEHPCNTPDDVVAKGLSECSDPDLDPVNANSVMFPYSYSGITSPSEADMDGVTLLFPPNDERPVKRVVAQDGGCGCSSPGRHSPAHPLLLLMVFLVAGLLKASRGDGRERE